MNIPNLLTDVDAGVSAFISDVFSGLATTIQTPATTMMSLAIMLLGIFTWMGYTKLSLGEIGKLVFKLFFVWALITQWPMYNFWFVNFFTNTPDQVAGAMLSNSPLTSATVSPSSSAGVTAYISGVWAKFDSFAVKAASDGNYFTGFLMFLVVALAQIIFLGYGTILLIIAKIAIAVLLGLAPLFLIAVLFGGTNKLFETWLQYLFNYMFLPILVFAAILVPLYVVDNILTDLLAGGSAVGFTDIFKVLFFSLIGFLVLHQTPTIAAGLAGGIALSTLNVVALSYRAGKGGVGRANKGEQRFWNKKSQEGNTRGERLRSWSRQQATRPYSAAKSLRANNSIQRTS